MFQHVLGCFYFHSSPLTSALSSLCCVQEFDDETIRERIIALQEMFPAPVQKAIGAVGSTTSWMASSSLGWAKTGGWLVASTSIMLLMPFAILQQLDVQQVELEKLLTGSDTQRGLLMAGPQAPTN
jgi:hypothetical protein